MNEEVALFVATLLHSSTNAHFMHWATNSASDHETLGVYYDKIIELTDSFAEAYMGRYEQIKQFPSDWHVEREPVAYLVKMKDFVGESRKLLPQDSELQNIIDEIADLINTTLFKLKYLD